MNRKARKQETALFDGNYLARTWVYAPVVIALATLTLFASEVLLAALKFPDLSGRVVDEAALLSSSQAADLGSKLAAHEEATTNQVVVVTLKSLQGAEIEDFGYKLGRHWGIGQEGKDNGVLLIVAPTERKVRIEVGYGLEGTLTDALSKTIIEQEIIPRFKKGDMGSGIVAGTDAILAVLGGKYSPPSRVMSGDQSTATRLTAFVIALFLGTLFLGSLLSDVMNPTLVAGLLAGGATALAVVITDMVVLWLIIGALVFLFVKFIVLRLDKLLQETRGSIWGGGGFGGRRGGFGSGGFSGGGGSFGGGGASGGW